MPRPNSLAEKIFTLLEKHHLLSAPEILALLKKQGDRYNKTSVYRALDKLLSEEKLCRHSFGQEASYELREHHHAHLVCSECGKIQSAPCTVPELKKGSGFVADHHHLTVFGKCATCAHKTDNPGKEHQ